MVHGSATTHRCFDLVADGFADHFRVLRYDRRGHGASGDSEDWSFRREVDDLIELASEAAAGSRVRVVGYSFGGSIALHAAASRPSLFGPLVLYEPPFGVPGLITCADDVLVLLDEGRQDDAARTFITTTFGLSDGVVDAMQRHPLWADTDATVHNLRRELPVVTALGPPALASPQPAVAILLTHPDSNRAFAAISEVLVATLGAVVVPIPGMSHFAMATEPERFVEAALAHLVWQ